MSEKENSGFKPGSAEFYECIANAAADDDVIDGPANDFYAAYFYFKAAKAGKKGK